MDIMNIESNFMTGLIGKIIEKSIKKKVGSNVDVDLKQIGFKTLENDIIRAQLNISVDISKDDLSKLIDELTDK